MYIITLDLNCQVLGAVPVADIRGLRRTPRYHLDRAAGFELRLARGGVCYLKATSTSDKAGWLAAIQDCAGEVLLDHED